MPVEMSTRSRLRIGGNEIGERLAGARARFGEEDAAVLEHLRDGGRHLDLAGTRLEVGHRASQRAVGRKDRDLARSRRSVGRFRPAYAPGTAGTSGTALDFGANHRQRASSSGACRARVNSSPIDFHLGFAHPARRDGRRADADAAGDHRRILVERNRVLVDRDAGLAERGLGDLAGDALGEDVDQHQVIVGAAADQAEARRREHAARALRRWRRSAAGSRRTPAPPPP